MSKIPFFQTPQGTPTAPEEATTEPLTVILLGHTPSLCTVSVVNYPVPANVKEVSVSLFYSLFKLRDSPTLPSPASLIYHQWISWNTPLMFPPLILLYKISCKFPFFGALSHSVWLSLPSNCCHFGSNKHKNSLQVWTFLTPTYGRVGAIN